MADGGVKESASRRLLFSDLINLVIELFIDESALIITILWSAWIIRREYIALKKTLIIEWK